MPLYVVPAEGGDSVEQNDATCQSNEEEENVNQQEESEEDMDNTDLDDSAVSWDTWWTPHTSVETLSFVKHSMSETYSWIYAVQQ